jgi:hypothetical protein
MGFFMKTVFLSFIYLIGGIVFASEQKQDPLANKANKILDQQIGCFQVLGERCSGTNYVHALIEENLKDLRSSGCISKHFIPWYLDKAKINSNSYYQVPIQNILYIVVIRDVFDWVRSFYETPHHTDGSIKKLSFTNFIRTPWKPKEENIEKNERRFWQLFAMGQVNSNNEDSLPYYIDKMDPVTKKPFKNILHLRTQKYQNYIEFANYVNNIIYVRYEDVLANPEEFISFVSNFTNAKPSNYKSITTYKNEFKKIYKPKKYFEINKSDRKFILLQIDQNLEKEFGYNYNQ